jgi:hypothetical protein
MKPRRRKIVLLILAAICIVIKWYSISPDRVENTYSNQFFPLYTKWLRTFYGEIPISIGDIFYGLVVVWLLYRLLAFLVKLSRQKKYFTRTWVKNFLYRFLVAAAVIYIIFNISWGINYNRKGISTQLDLQQDKYTITDLKEMNCLLIDKVNQSKGSLIMHEREYPSTKSLIQIVNNSYQQLSLTYPYLAYSPASLKKSIWSQVGNYAGFSGYYNPFTAEAQFNSTIPRFLQPFTACHEVAHQLGYAKEQEANFVGYLAATASKDTLMHYSVYLELFMYANRNLANLDSLTAKVYRDELIGPVKDDIDEWIRFNRKHIGLLEPLVKWTYDVFLQSNEQPQGILSYDKVTGFIINYYKKFKKI